MKVYIVQQDCYHESEEVLGVFGSIEKATKAAKQAAESASPIQSDDAIVVIEAELDVLIENPSPYIHGHALARYPVKP